MRDDRHWDWCVRILFFLLYLLELRDVLAFAVQGRVFIIWVLKRLLLNMCMHCRYLAKTTVILVLKKYSVSVKSANSGTIVLTMAPFISGS